MSHYTNIWPFTDLDNITEFDFLPNCVRWFPKNICNGYGMPTEDAYSSGHLVLSDFETCICSNVEINLSWSCLRTLEFRTSFGTSVLSLIRGCSAVPGNNAIYLWRAINRIIKKFYLNFAVFMSNFIKTYISQNFINHQQRILFKHTF